MGSSEQYRFAQVVGRGPFVPVVRERGPELQVRDHRSNPVGIAGLPLPHLDTTRDVDHFTIAARCTRPRAAKQVGTILSAPR
jgi:hypothetical protein